MNNTSTVMCLEAIAKPAAIARAQVTSNGLHRYVAEASDLGWPPGYFPKRLKTDLGNGQDLTLKSLTSEKAFYEQDMGCIGVTVFND